MSPMPVKFKDVFEQDLEDNLSSIELTYPPNHDEYLAVNPTYIHVNSWVDDLLDIPQTAEPVIAISYPKDDIPFLKRFMGDLGRKVKVKHIDVERSDEVPDSFDLVNDATTVSFVVTLTEYNVHHLEIYTNVPTSSTSRLIVEIFNETTGTKIVKRYFYNSAIERNGWTKIDIEIPSWNPDDDMRITLTEWGSFGSDPDGIEIHKNAAGEHLVRVYSYDLTQMKTVWYKGIMRLSVFAKDKTVEADPEGAFLAKQRVAGGVARVLQDHIIKNWTHLQREARFLNIEPSSGSSLFLESEYRADVVMDVSLAYRVSVPIETYKVIKSLEINQLNLL